MTDPGGAASPRTEAGKCPDCDHTAIHACGVCPDCPQWHRATQEAPAPEGLRVRALVEAITGQNLYHGRHGTTPAGYGAAAAILSVLREAGWTLQAAQEAPAPEGLRLRDARLLMIDGIGADLSREFAQGDPFEPFDRTYVVKQITRVLDAARDRTRTAAPPTPAEPPRCPTCGRTEKHAHYSDDPAYRAEPPRPDDMTPFLRLYGLADADMEAEYESIYGESLAAVAKRAEARPPEGLDAALDIVRALPGFVPGVTLTDESTGFGLEPSPFGDEADWLQRGVVLSALRDRAEARPPEGLDAAALGRVLAGYRERDGRYTPPLTTTEPVRLMGPQEWAREIAARLSAGGATKP